jgi:transcription termination/antitermination protein NusG
MSGSCVNAEAVATPAVPIALRASQRDDMPHWFAVETRHRFEKKVVAQLDNKGVRVFLPLLTEHHSWTDRQQGITIPLFPGYVFVHIDQSQDSCRAVLRTVGMIRFVRFGGVITAVPAKEIEDLQLLLQKKGLFSLHAFARTGQRVRIRGGCLHGLEGILVEHEKDKLVISIQSIQRSLAVEIQGYDLELV